MQEKNEQLRILEQVASMKQSYELLLNEIKNRMTVLNQKEEEINQVRLIVLIKKALENMRKSNRSIRLILYSVT